MIDMKLHKLTLGILLALPVTGLAAITENDITGRWEHPYLENEVIKIVKSGNDFAMEEYSENPDTAKTYTLCKCKAAYDAKAEALKVALDTIDCEVIGEQTEPEDADEDEEDDDTPVTYAFVETRQLIQKAGDKVYGVAGYIGPESGETGSWSYDFNGGYNIQVAKTGDAYTLEVNESDGGEETHSCSYKASYDSAKEVFTVKDKPNCVKIEYDGDTEKRSPLGRDFGITSFEIKKVIRMEGTGYQAPFERVSK